MRRTIFIIIGAVLVVGVSFWGGARYGGSRNQTASIEQRFVSGANLSPAEREQRIAQFGGGAQRNGAGNGGAPVAGSIIAKDDQSITVQLQDGGSKIVFFSTSTHITKSENATTSDLANGTQVFVNGTANSDGSVVAQSIQLR